MHHRQRTRRALRGFQSLERRQMLAAGANLALYEFTNNTSSNPEFFSTDVHAETTASDINSPLSLGWTGNGAPPNGLALGGAFNETSEPTPAGGQPDYFQLTITPDSGYPMNVSRLSMQIRRNDPNSKNSYAVYFDNDPGAGGDNFATKLTSGVITSEDVFETVAVDVEGMPGFVDQTTALTFRVYVWGTVGTGTMRLDNIRVQSVLQTVSESSLAYYGDAGRLLHPLDPLGNRIADFSAAGYKNGNEPIPNIAATIDASRIVQVSPIAGDDMPTIQAAINQVAAMPMDSDGFRGVVQLSAGEFQISNQLLILDSGVVLRGVGDGDDPASSTILRATGTLQRSIIRVGASSGFASGISNTTHNIVDKYVPVGATSLTVDSTNNWSVGDAIVVDRQSTANWISDIGMDSIPPRSDGGTVVQWSPGGNYDHLYERVITRVEGNRIFLNAPLMSAFEQQYGGGTVWRYTFPRINNVGIENIRGKSDFVSATDENHARTFIELQAVEDAWVQNITGQHLVYATVHATSRSMRVTVDDAQSLDPVSIVTGGRRYPFTIDGQFILMRNLFSEEGRHDFVNNSSWRNRGPNVFLNGTAVNSNSSTGPHQRWSTGTLYDTISTDNMIEARNRGNFGTGHGWAGANMVFWNTSAAPYIVQNPPTAQNWVIGGSGQIVDETRFGPQPMGTFREHEQRIDFQDPANPTSSLYVAQHNQRTAEPDSQRREYVIGDFDLIQYDGASSVDAVAVDSAWQQAVETIAAGTISQFDQVLDGNSVPFTFSYELAANEIVHAATLHLGLRGTGGDTSNDVLRLESLSDIRSLTDLGLTSALSTTETTPLLVELTGNDLLQLNDGLLNLMISENTAVDWAVLDLKVAPSDFGDAPAPRPTLLVDDGVRHAAVGPQLGPTRDTELDGQPSATAEGDAGDEDGVDFGLIQSESSTAGVNILLEKAAAGKVDAWIDFNDDGDWDDAGEKILHDVLISHPMQTLNYNLPSGLTAGDRVARVRLSSVGGLSPTGAAADGEVEDYLVNVLPPPIVENVVISNGDAQRSNITSIRVTFDRVVDIDNANNAFMFFNTTINDAVADVPVVDNSSGKTIVDFTFVPNSPSVNQGGGLLDGVYTLTIDADLISFEGTKLDGDGNGESGDDHVFGADSADKFYRKYGDNNGNEIVDLIDFAAFRSTFGSTPNDSAYIAALDNELDNVVGLIDFAAFRSNFGS